MDELIEASLRFPVVVFTIGLGIVLVYWLFVLLGGLAPPTRPRTSTKGPKR